MAQTNTGRTHFKKGHTPWNKGLHIYMGGKRFEKGQIPWNLGKKYKNPKISLANKGKHYAPKTEISKRQHFSPNTEFKKGNLGYWLDKKRPNLSGKKHPNWKGGITEDRRSWQYKVWQKAVFERDKWTCVLCGYRSKKRKDINADHILPYSLYPHLRFEVGNGRTLCVECHKKTPTYGNRSPVVAWEVVPL